MYCLELHCWRAASYIASKNPYFQQSCSQWGVQWLYTSRTYMYAQAGLCVCPPCHHCLWIWRCGTFSSISHHAFQSPFCGRFGLSCNVLQLLKFECYSNVHGLCSHSEGVLIITFTVWSRTFLCITWRTDLSLFGLSVKHYARCPLVLFFMYSNLKTLLNYLPCTNNTTPSQSNLSN